VCVFFHLSICVCVCVHVIRVDLERICLLNMLLNVLLNVLAKHACFVYARDWKTASKCMHVYERERERARLCVYRSA